jgi:hypothetical protein
VTTAAANTTATTIGITGTISLTGIAASELEMFLPIFTTTLASTVGSFVEASDVHLTFVDENATSPSTATARELSTGTVIAYTVTSLTEAEKALALATMTAVSADPTSFSADLLAAASIVGIPLPADFTVASMSKPTDAPAFVSTPVDHDNIDFGAGEPHVVMPTPAPLARNEGGIRASTIFILVVNGMIVLLITGFFVRMRANASGTKQNKHLTPTPSSPDDLPSPTAEYLLEVIDEPEEPEVVVQEEPAVEMEPLPEAAQPYMYPRTSAIPLIPNEKVVLDPLERGIPSV